MKIFGGKANVLDEAREAAKDNPIHLRVEDVHKSFGSHHVLKGVSFDVFRRKTNLIIGPSGSGKTVLLRSILRLDKPDSGRILLDGVDIVPIRGRGLNDLRRRFGMVFQMSALFDSMNVFDNVAFPLREHTSLSEEEVRDRVMGRLDALGVEHAWQKTPAELSGGMQKRVAVARALVLESDIIIYDEPTTGLDPVTSRAVDDLIREMEERFGVTSIVISHDMASVFRIADHLTFLSFGRVVAHGTPTDALATDDPSAREFLDASGVTLDALEARGRAS
jgi:phospholipid/cholesterol/gamma-HCH transport system ATP-binding protein